MADMPRELFKLQVPSGCKMLLALLWTYAGSSDDAPLVWPGHATLIELTGQNERTVRRQLTRLEGTGAIKKTWVGERWGWRLHRTPTPGPDTHARAHTPANTSPTGHARPEDRTSVPANRTPRPGGAYVSDRTSVPADPDMRVRKTGRVDPPEPPGTTRNHQLRNRGAPPVDPPEISLLTADQIAQKPTPKAKIRELWSWYERELHRRKLRRKPKGLPDDTLRSIERLIRHIRQALDCDFDAAIESQRAHLRWRLQQAEDDASTRKYLNTPTPWRAGWWDWWHDREANTETPPKRASDSKEFTLW